MKKAALTFLFVFAACSCFAAAGDSAYMKDSYRLTMSVRVPRIYDNTESQGYRKYQIQTIKGQLSIHYPLSADETVLVPFVTVDWLTNQTHKIGGKKIGYSCMINNGGELDGPITRVSLIGNNKKNVFRTPSIVFYLDAEPDYSIGEDDEDNSLLVTVSGTGSDTVKTAYYRYQTVTTSRNGYVLTSQKKTKLFDFYQLRFASGKLAGTLGCGCRAYGHVSPTRVAGAFGPTDEVDDVASVDGTWSISYDAKASNRFEGAPLDLADQSDWTYSETDGWVECLAGNGKGGSGKVFYCPATHDTVYSLDYAEGLLPAKYSWDLSEDRRFPSSRQFYAANVGDWTVFSDLFGNFIVKARSGYYGALFDVLSPEAGFAGLTDFSSAYIVSVQSKYWLLADATAVEMTRMPWDDLLGKKAGQYWTCSPAGSRVEIRYYPSLRTAAPGKPL